VRAKDMKETYKLYLEKFYANIGY